MHKYDYTEVIKLIETLTGDIEPIGDSHYDAEILKHISDRMDIIEDMIVGLHNVYMNNASSNLGSVVDCTSRIADGIDHIQLMLHDISADIEDKEAERRHDRSTRT